MTLYYDIETNSIIENHPHWVRFDEEGRLIMDFDEVQYDDKILSLLKAAGDLMEASDSYELTQDVEWDFTGEE